MPASTPSSPSSPDGRAHPSVARRRLLTGCAIGCGAALVILVGLATLFIRWYRKEAPLPAADHSLLTGRETSYFTLALDAEDEGEDALFSHAVEVLSHRQLPPSLAVWGPMLDSMSRQDPKEVLGVYLPIRYSLLCYPAGEDGRGGWVQAIGFTKLFQVIGFVVQQQMRDPDSHLTPREHRKQTLYVSSDGGSARAFVGSHLLLGSPPARVEEAMDRLLEPRASALPPLAAELGREAGREAETTDMWGFLLDASRSLPEAWERAQVGAERPPAGTPPDSGTGTLLSRIQAGALALDIVDQDRASGRIVLRTLSPPDPGDRPALEAAARRALAAFLPAEATVELDARWSDDRTLVMEGEIGGLALAIDRSIDSMLDAAAQGSAPAP